ncbi:hypothetical protein COLO4_19309 [Corchorus olitorius]|uniref:Uncharacterized protein n=1 Tax=Corchorus olitorius TaxID=93759 RepID=A0A1R3J5Q2_9ROSI|nr:hypothetical protein COLO4_19309 [Corchorus olitorius]
MAVCVLEESVEIGEVQCGKMERGPGDECVRKKMRVREGLVVVGRWLPRKWDMIPSKMSWLQVRDLLTLG